MTRCWILSCILPASIKMIMFVFLLFCCFYVSTVLISIYFTILTSLRWMQRITFSSSYKTGLMKTNDVSFILGILKKFLSDTFRIALLTVSVSILFYKFYYFILFEKHKDKHAWKRGRERGNEKRNGKREISHLLSQILIIAKARSGPCWSQELRTKPIFPMWLGVTQVLVLTPAA